MGKECSCYESSCAPIHPASALLDGAATSRARSRLQSARGVNLRVEEVSRDERLASVLRLEIKEALVGQIHLRNDLLGFGQVRLLHGHTTRERQQPERVRAAPICIHPR